MTIFLVFLFIAAIFALFVWERFPPDLIALGVLVAVVLFGWITPGEAFSAFANEAPITVAAMFVLSAALQRSGLITDIGRRLRRVPRLGEARLLVLLMTSIAACSAFVNNTPVVVAFLPVVLGLAAHCQIKASKLLIPLSYAAIFGGTCTLIGTSTNLAVSSLARSKYGIEISIFAISGIGLLTAAAGILYMATIGRRLLPERESLAELLEGTPRDYATSQRVPANSPLVGRRLGETDLGKIASVRVRQVMREGQILLEPRHDLTLAEGDVLSLGGKVEALLEVEAMEGLAPVKGPDSPTLSGAPEEKLVVEALVMNQSHFSGRTVPETRLTEEHGAEVLAIHRHGENITENLHDLRLRFGDTLLLRLSAGAMARLRSGNDLLVLTDTAQPQARRRSQPVVLAVLAGVVALAAFNIYPISVLALTGVVVLVLARALQMREVYDAVDWRIVAMIVGMIALGTAMERTGAAGSAASMITDMLHGMHPMLVLATFYLMATILTEMISNNAVAILMTPVAAQTADALGLNVLPFLIALMFAASASFATPVGYQTNTFVYGAGGYRFADFLKVGVPLNLLFLLLATILIPLFFPLR